MTTFVRNNPWSTRTSLNLMHVSYDGIAAADGDVAYVDLNSLFQKGQVNLGIQIQAINTSVAIDITLYEPRIATDPEHAENTNAIWHEIDASVTNEVIGYFSAATALRLRFLTTAGQVIIGTC
jgi:hypothetical protein